MQDWKSHLIFGLLLAIVWFSAIYFFNVFSLTFESAFLLVMLVMFATLFADIDLRKSKIRDVLSLTVSAILSIVYMFLFPQTWYYGLAYFLVLYFLLRQVRSKHRGFTHTIWFAIIFSALMTMLLSFVLPLTLSDLFFWFIVTFSAYALHLLLDKL